MTPTPTRSARTMARFFIPLAIQAMSQALSYPLVAMVASRGPGGPLNLAGLAQSNTVMFFLGMFAFSLVTTGMVFAKTREGYQTFRLVTLSLGLVVISVQALLSIPALAHILFADLIGLPPSIEAPAKTTLYARLGWEYWQGPLFHRKNGKLIRDPVDEALMILRLPKTPDLNLSLPISVEWREGEVW